TSSGSTRRPMRCCPRPAMSWRHPASGPSGA
ncbi:uncharacterized protein METZ01_LOCUS491615, partial [marine metagenome]